MALNQATNITPSLSGAFSLGNGVVDAANDMEITWQVNGQSAMTAYQVTIYRNDAASTLVFTTNKVVLDEPFYGKDALGNFVFFSFSIPAETLETAGIVNGGNYKFSLRQWWGDTDAESVTQNNAAAFITRAVPELEMDEIEAPVAARKYTFTAEYTQEQGDALNWVRWQIAAVSDPENPIYDSQSIYTALLSCTYDGFFSGESASTNNYSIRCTIQTVNGVEVSTGWVDFTVFYGTSPITGLISAQCLPSIGAVKVSWPRLTTIPGAASGSYEISDGKLHLIAGNYVIWDKVNGRDMNFPESFSVLWNGTISANGDSAQEPLIIGQGNNKNITILFKNNKVSMRTNEGLRIGPPVEWPYASDEINVTCIFTPAKVYWRISTTERLDILVTSANTTLYEPYYRWKKYNAVKTYQWEKHAVQRRYHWKKYTVAEEYSDTVLTTTGTKRYSHVLEPETMVINAVPQIVVIDGQPKYDFSGGRQTVVQSDYTPVGSYCAANNDSIKTDTGGVGNYHSYYAKVLSINDNSILGWISSSDANAEIHNIKTTRLRGEYVGDVDSLDANAYPQNAEQGGYWYVYESETHEMGGLMGTVRDTQPSAYPQNAEQGGYWYVYIGFIYLQGEYIQDVRVFNNENAYPQNGKQGDYWYIYIGDEYIETPNQYNQSEVTSVRLNGAQISDYIEVISQVPDESVLQKAWQEGNYRPAFGSSTYMLADFSSSLDAGVITGEIPTTVVDWALYRQRGDERLVRVGDFLEEVLTIYDYTIRNRRGAYRWSIYAKSADKFITAESLDSNLITPCFWDWALLSCEETDYGYFRVKQVFRFKLNVETNAISNNNQPSIYKNFTRYPTIMPTTQNYKSGTLKGLIGAFGYGENGSYTYSDSIAVRDAIMALPMSGNRLFLRSRKGDLMEIQISGEITMETMDASAAQAQTANIPWAEVADASDVSLIAFDAV